MSEFAPSDFVVQSIEDRLVAWRQLEQKAAEVEKSIAVIGQAAADPRMIQLVSDARFLRQKADREFAAILRAVKHQ